MVDISKLMVGKNLTETEKTVLRYMIEHIEDAMKLGVRGIAKENFTSSSTVMRLTKKMGYAGFVDMYYKLLPYVKNASGSLEMNMQFVDDFTSTSLLKYDSYKQMKELARLIHRMTGQFIFIYATGFSAILAEYLNKKLLVLGQKCIYSNGMDSIGVFENNLEHMGLLISVSRSGETKSVLDRVRTAVENNIPVVSFTNDTENSIRSLADFTFTVEDSNKLDDRNMMANTFFPNVLMLMELLIYEYHKAALEKCEKKI